MLVSVAAPARPAVDPLAVAGVAEFTAAGAAWDGARFDAAAGMFRRVTTNAPDSVVAFYWLGVSEFHRMLQVRSRPEAPAQAPVAEAAMEAAMAALQRVLELDRQHPEAHALLGTLYGMRIEGSLFRALRFGPRIESHRRAALKLGSDNPRVQFLLGTCQFHTARKPAGFREALESFRTAETLFEREARLPAGPLEPRWGHASCLSFIGRTYEALGEAPHAAEYYRRALAACPADHASREGLARVQADR